MAADHNDADEKPGGVTPVIKQTGLPNTIKGKAQRFILRWLAGGIGNPYVRQIRDNLDELDGRSRINMMLAEEAGRHAIADPIVMDRFKARILGDLYRKHENVEAVAQAAQAKIDAESNAETETGATSEPSEDWMNAFTNAAEGASSDQLRDRLASVLAGEIKSPGSVSRSTIRFIAEVGTDDLQQFDRILNNRYRDNIYVEAGWEKGEMLLSSKGLESLGLLSTDVNNSIHLGADGTGFLLGYNHALVIQGDSGTAKYIDVWPLTRLGREVASLLNKYEEKSVFFRISSFLSKDNLKSIRLGLIGSVVGDQVTIGHQEILWSAPIPGIVTMPQTPNPFNSPGNLTTFTGLGAPGRAQN